MDSDPLPQRSQAERLSVTERVARTKGSLGGSDRTDGRAGARLAHLHPYDMRRARW
jgi:hypothetical protein